MRENSLQRHLLGQKSALVALIILTIVAVAALIGPNLFGGVADKINLRARNLPPFSLENGPLYVLGADSLGRSILARLVVAARNTIGIAVGAVSLSLLLGGLLGTIAGLWRGWIESTIMRSTDVVMSFPSLLMALIVLYLLGPSPLNIVIVLALTRMPVYVRTSRATVLELRERNFVAASRVMGGHNLYILRRHILPQVLPTLITVGALDFAFVILAESALSFLGIGIQPPEITWGLMVAEGRSYLTSAWWLSFWPGLVITVVALSANILANWWRRASDPGLRAQINLGKRVNA
jgi:peptide/nickel transport system permease protein